MDQDFQQLIDAINHCIEIQNKCNGQCNEDHKQLQMWLEQLLRIKQSNRWINLKDKQPDINEKCWVVNNKGELYLCRYWDDGIFKKRMEFMNLLGRGWKVGNVLKWQALIIPEP